MLTLRWVRSSCWKFAIFPGHTAAVIKVVTVALVEMVPCSMIISQIQSFEVPRSLRGIIMYMHLYSGASNLCVVHYVHYIEKDDGADLIVWTVQKLGCTRRCQWFLHQFLQSLFNKARSIGIIQKIWVPFWSSSCKLQSSLGRLNLSDAFLTFRSPAITSLDCKQSISVLSGRTLKNVDLRSSKTTDQYFKTIAFQFIALVA